jgi:hypothetical protein
MKITWPKIAFSLPWFFVLGWALFTDLRDGDAEAEVFAFAILSIAGLPISFIFMGLIKLMGLVVSHELLGSNFNEIWSSSIFMSGMESSFKPLFLIWWLITFSGALWQWFWLLPKALRALRPWMERGDAGAPR